MPNKFGRITEFTDLASKVIEEDVVGIVCAPVEIEGKPGLKVVATGRSGGPTVDFDTVTKKGTVSAGISDPIPSGLGRAGLKVADIAAEIVGNHCGTKFEFCPEVWEEKKEGEGKTPTRVLVRRSQWSVFSFEPESPRTLHHVTVIADPGEQE